MALTATELAAWIQISSTAGLAPAQWRAALRVFGSPESVLSASRTALAAVLGEADAKRLKASPDAALLDSIERARLWAQHPGNHCIELGSEHYPPGLLELPDPPALIYAQGDLALTRLAWCLLLCSPNASREGQLNARQFASTLFDAGIALMCFAGTGFEAELARFIATHTAPYCIAEQSGLTITTQVGVRGLAVSLQPPGTKRAAQTRGTPLTLAGLARSVLVIEAALHSSAVSTATWAAECGREIFAIPGSIHAPLSKGCHRLIKDGAKLVETARDIVDDVKRINALQG